MSRSHLVSVLLLVSCVVPVQVWAEPVQVGEKYSRVISSDDTVSEIAPVVSYDGSSTVWTYTLFHENASYIDLHFANMDFDPYCTLEISDADGGQRNVYSDQGRNNLGTFWAHCVFGDTAILTVVCMEKGEQADFEIDEYGAGYPDFDINSFNTESETTPERHLRSPSRDEALMPWEMDRELSLCGDNDMRNSQCYEHGQFSTEYQKSKAVAKILIDGIGACTGFLAGENNILITNGPGHCITSNEDALNADYLFGYEVDGGGDCDSQFGAEYAFGEAFDAQELLASSLQHDYALISLLGDPVSTYGYLDLDNRLPEVEETVYIPQHPGGADKIIAIYDDSLGSNKRCQVMSTSGGACYGASYTGYDDIRYTCDTLGGSSGSPVISAETDKVVALHHCGGACNGNFGVPIVEIYDELSPYLYGTAPPTPVPVTNSPTYEVCPDDFHQFKLELKTDSYGMETSWDVQDSSGNIIYESDTVYGGFTEYEYSLCLDEGIYTFTIHDAYSDGICCTYLEGYYKLFFDGVQIAEGGEFGAEESVEFGSTSAPSDSPQLLYTATADTDAPTEAPTTFICGEGLYKFHLELQLDHYAAENFWKLDDSSGNLVLEDGDSYDNNALIDVYHCLPPDEYTFTLYDAFGDGICCEDGNGYYNLWYDGVQVGSGTGDFLYSESHTFGAT